MNNFDINKFLMEIHKKYFEKNLLLFLLGNFLGAFSFNLFFQRYSVVSGGATGLSILIDKFTVVDVSIILLIINLVCLLIGLIFFGWEQALKMLAITFIYPVFIKGTSYLTNMIDLEDTSMFLVMVIGGGLSGYATGLIRNSGYSPGGFAVIYDMMHKYLHLSIGVGNTIINTILIVSGGLIYGMDRIVYAIISLLVTSYMVDRVTIGISDNKVFYIVTEKPLEVKEYINNNLHYDVTLINARGGYTNKKRKMLMSVISTRDYVSLKELVKAIDKKAFFLIMDTYESSVRKKLQNAEIYK